MNDSLLMILCARGGGGAFIVRDIKNRLFPTVKYGLGLRRKDSAKPRIARFFTNKTKVELDSVMLDKISKYSSDEDDSILNEILSFLEEVVSQHELAFLLDQYDVLTKTSLEQANYVIRKYRRELHSKIFSYENLTSGQRIFLSQYNYLVGSSLHSRSQLDNIIVSFGKHLSLEVIKLERPHGEKNENFFDFNFLISLYRDFYRQYLPFIYSYFDSCIDSIFFDTRTTPDKFNGPFCKIRGVNKDIYISCPLTSSCEYVLNLLHEITHSLFYYGNVISGGKTFLYWQRSPLINEIIAFITEFIFIDFLNVRNYSFHYNVLYASNEMSAVYLEGKEKVGYKNTCYHARVLASQIALNHKYNNRNFCEFIYTLFDKGASINIDEVLNLLMNLNLSDTP